MFKKLLVIFVYAFLLNLVWENLHSLLYVHYRNGEITQLILLRATLFDAVFISVLGIFFLKISYLNKRPYIFFMFGFVAAVVIELFALKTGRWAYNEFMPVIPLIKTGLTPTIQLGFISYFIFRWFSRNSSSTDKNFC